MDFKVPFISSRIKRSRLFTPASVRVRKICKQRGGGQRCIWCGVNCGPREKYFDGRERRDKEGTHQKLYDNQKTFQGGLILRAVDHTNVVKSKIFRGLRFPGGLPGVFLCPVSSFFRGSKIDLRSL